MCFSIENKSYKKKICANGHFKMTTELLPPWSSWSTVLTSSRGGEEGRGAVCRGIPLDICTPFTGLSG